MSDLIDAGAGEGSRPVQGGLVAGLLADENTDPIR
jgi:hypothetical protein